MSNKKFCGIMLALLLIGILASNIQQAKALTEIDRVIYIKEDGSIVYIDFFGNEEPLPPEGPITTTDNITYTLTDDIKCSGIDYETGYRIGIVVKRNNIIIDGQTYTLEGVKTLESSGVYLYGISNVTIKNVNIKAFFYGIHLEWSSNNTISGNNLTNNIRSGVYLTSNCANNSISGNSITNNGDGICFVDNCTYNSITENNIANNNGKGISLAFSNYNIIFGNNVTNNEQIGMGLSYAINNTIYYNWFIDNAVNRTKAGGSQIISIGSFNFWDNGTIGNYWSDYTGYDGNGDGIGDTPYTIDRETWPNPTNFDRYPIWTVPPPPRIPIELIAAAVAVIIVIAGVTVFIRRRRKEV